MIFRVRHQSRFVAVRNASVRDPNLSLKATGLLVFLLSFPDDASFTREQIARMKPDGVAAIRSGLRELADAGYLTYERLQGPDGRWHTTVVLQEVPVRPVSPKAENPPSVACENRRKPKAGFPTVGFPASKEEVPTTKDLADASPQQPSAASSPPPEPPRLVRLVNPERISELRKQLAEGGIAKAVEA